MKLNNFIEEYKKIILMAFGAAICMLAAGLLWWYIPYYHPIKRTDEHLGYIYRIEEDKIHLIKYIGEDKIVHVSDGTLWEAQTAF